MVWARKHVQSCLSLLVLRYLSVDTPQFLVFFTCLSCLPSCFKMGESNDHVNMLIEKINLHDLKEGAVFEFDSETLDEGFQKALQRESEYYPGNELAKNLDLIPGAVLNDAMDDKRIVPGSVEFAAMALKMENVTNDGRIKKLIIRPGEGPIIPETALVEMHYSSYFEFADEPFDSSYLRGRPVKLVPSSGDCLPGILIAIASMKKKEYAQFLIHPSLGYGKMGAPPRIPPNAEFLFEVEIINFIDGVQTVTDNGEGNAVNVMKTANAKYLEGNQYYKKGRSKIPDAIIKYKKALSMLDQCVQETEDGEEERKRLIITLCSNLALCFNKTQNYQQTCKMCRRILTMKPNHCKALFSYGRALLRLGEFDAAREHLLKAKHMEPTNVEINSEIVQLDKEHSTYLASAKTMSKRMFDGLTKETTETEIEKNNTKWYNYLVEFAKNSKSTTLTLPRTVTVQELEDIKVEALSLGLTVQKENNVVCIRK